MKRILQVVGGMNRAGAETMLMNLYKHIDISKYQFDFVYFTSEKCDYDQDIAMLGGQIFRITNVNPVKRAVLLYKIVKENGPYLAVHSHTNNNSFMHHFPALLGGVKKRITHSHCSNSQYLQTRTGRFYLGISNRLNKILSNRYVACGRAASLFLFPRVDQSKVTILPNAVSLDDYLNPDFSQYSSVRKLLSINSTTPLIVQIGRISNVKNFEFTIGFAAYLKSKGKKCNFAFLGTGELYNKLSKKIIDDNLTDSVHFIGVRDDVSKVLHESSCMIMPSLHEGFPVVLVEAQATGTPCLISDSISNEVDLGLNLVGFCSLQAPFEEWEKQLDILLGNLNVSKENISKTIISKGFSVIESAKKLEEIYEK